MREHPLWTDQTGEPVMAAFDAELDPAMVGSSRHVQLAEAALREVCEPLEEMPARVGAMPLFVGVPELRPGFVNEDAGQIQAALSNIGQLPIELRRADIYVRGHSAGVSALLAGLQALRRGQCEMCLVGGVDSYFHPDTIEWLDANRQLAGAVSRSGFVPGEAAAFCLLANESACARWDLRPHARVLEAALGMEDKLIKTEALCLGVGLTHAVQSVLGSSDASSRLVDGIYCDINGERYRSEEWGFAALRLAQWFSNPSGYVSPADRWGDVGAASGPLFAMLASSASTRGAAKASRTLLWTSSEQGLRGAVLLSRVTDQ